MKRFLVFFIVLLIIILQAPYCNGESIESIIPDEAYESYDFKLDKEEQSSELLSFFSFQNLISLIVKGVTKSLPDVLHTLWQIFPVLLIVSLLEQLGLTGKGRDYQYVTEVIGTGIIMLIVFKQFSTSCEMVRENLETIRIFCDASVPIITALLISGGKNFTAMLFSYGISISSAVITALSSGICLPLIRIYFAVGSCGAIWEDYNFDAFTDLIKKFIKWLIGIVFGVFTFTLSLQGVLSGASDSLARRTLKAAASSIPVMGGLLSSGLDGAYVLVSGTKTATALIGIAVIVAIFAAPVIFVGLEALVLSLLQAVAALFGSKGITCVLKTAQGSFVLLLGLFLVSVLMSIICYLVICLGVG